jgi:hypothetical protein
LISIHKKTRIIKTLSYNIDHIYHNQEVSSCAYVFETGSQNKLFMYMSGYKCNDKGRITRLKNLGYQLRL